MQLGEMQHFNTTPLGEMQSGEIQFGEMLLSQHFYVYMFEYVKCMKYVKCIYNVFKK